MWTELGYRVRLALPGLGRLLGSWRLSMVLLVSAALYYAFLAIWSTSSPPHVVQSIARLAPFWILYALLLGNTAVCLWRRLPALRHAVSKDCVLGRSAPGFSVATPASIDREEIVMLLGRRGWRPAEVTEGHAAWVRRRWAALGTFLFHGSFFVVAVAAALTMAARDETRLWVAVGERYEARDDQVLSRSAPRLVGLGPLRMSFSVESIRPELWGELLLFTHLEARLIMADGREATTRINRPLWLGWGTFMRLSGFGYAPRYELRGGGGERLDSAFVKLNVFPPGQRDYFVPGGFPHRIYVEVLPDAERLPGGGLANRSLNLERPAVTVNVLRGKVDLGGADLFAGEHFAFEGLELSFPEIAYWGELTVVRDPGIPVLFVAFVLAVAGLALRLSGGRAELRWTAGADGGPGRLEGWGTTSPPSGLGTSAEGSR